MTDETNVYEDMNSVKRAYLLNDVQTADPQHLLVLLYDELRKQLRTVMLTADQSEWHESLARLNRSREIISYLIRSLNSVEGTVGRDLLRLYFYCLREIAQVMADRTTDRLENILPVIERLREAWAEAK